MNCYLDDLYAGAEALAHGPDRLTRVLEWRERTPPRLPAACRDAVLAQAPPATFDRWLCWLDGPGREVLAESGDAETTHWQVFWLRTLVVAARALACGADPLLVADELRGGSAAWPWLTDAFWRNLTAYLSTPPKTRLQAGARQVRFQFPLVLSEAAIVDGEETDQVLAEFVLEACPTTGGQVFPHPEQIAVRCLDAEFGATFRRAAAAVRSVPVNDSFPDVSVRIQPVRPEHEVFLREFVLRGGSGAGALALGLCLLRHGPRGTPSVEGVAASFALGTDEAGHWRCCPVGDLERKVRCCARARLRELIVSGQDAGPALTGFAKRNGITLSGEDDFAEAVRRLPGVTQHAGRIRPRPTRAKAWGGLGGCLGLALLTPLVVTPQALFSARCALHRAGDPAEFYDVSQDFSLYKNPDTMWAYGTMAPGQDPAVRTFKPYQEPVQVPVGQVRWQDRIWRDPNVLRNVKGTPIHLSDSIIWPTNQVSLHPGWRGQYSAVRWTAPNAGAYQVDAEFVGLDTNGPTATDAHVFQNGTELARADVSPSDPLFFSRQVRLVRGDHLFFVVGWGRKKRYEDQTTGLDLQIIRR